ncbi:hypothetical protein R5R35_005988 [Gryllus longicercus]|uniref:BTB domain-containing protein n=1 Tax=Gryllus longicercus TaxID=2509291 RepID=A0AAN9VSY2_9ORTH
MLSSEKESPEDILIPDVHPDAFDALLKYIYTGISNIDSVECASNLWYAAKKYMIPEMEMDCVNYLQNDVCHDNVCQIYEMSKLFEEQKLEQQCLTLISHHTNQVVNASSFEDAELTTIEAILDLVELQVESEVVLFKAIERWAKKECMRRGLTNNISEQRSLLKTVLLKIRFLTFSLEVFSKEVAPCPLFTREECFALLLNLASVKSAPSVPEGFSVCRELRKRPSVEIPNGYERFCSRKVLFETLLLNDGSLICSICFRTNYSINILGVEVRTQLFSYDVELLDMNSLPMIHSGTHNEEFEVNLLYKERSQNIQVANVTKSVRVKYDSSTKIFFDGPKKCKSNIDYFLTVTIKSKGWYPAGLCSPLTQVKSTVFTFCNENKQGSVTEGLIKSIVFMF